MSQDIRSILQRLNDLDEGRITPTAYKHGLNPQQKEVPQLPALFRPKGISVLSAKKDPKHPMSGFAVGADESREPSGSALEEAMQGIEEDMLSKVKKSLANYIDMLADKVKDEREIQQKAVKDVEDANPAKAGEQETHEQEIDEDPTQQDLKVTPPPNPENYPVMAEGPVKTYAMEDGATIECWGDSRSGFELRRGNRVLPTRFRNVNDADIAMKLWQQRRKSTADIANSNDYIEEK